MRHRKYTAWWLSGLISIIALIAGACSTPTPNPDLSPTAPQDQANQSTAPTRDPEAVFLQPSRPITRDNAPTIAQLGILETPDGRVSSIFTHDISLDGTRLVALNNDLMLVWNLTSGELLYSTERGDIVQVYFAPDQDEIYAVNNDGIVNIFDSTEARLINSVNAQSNFDGKSAYHADNGWLALGGTDGSIKVWLMPERTALATLASHTGEVFALGFDASGERLASAGADQLAKIWDWQTRTLLHAFDHIDINAEQVALAPDGTQLVTATLRYIAVWNTTTDDLAYSLAIERGGANDILMYNAEGDLIISGGGSSDLLIWRAETGEVIAQLPEVSGNRLSGVFGVNDSFLLTSVLDRAVSLWDIQNANQETVPRATLDIGTRRIVRADWTDDDFVMLFFDVNGVIYVWGIPPV